MHSFISHLLNTYIELLYDQFNITNIEERRIVLSDISRYQRSYIYKE